MADQVSTLILKVDLDCDLCYKKIRRTLSKLQEKEKIHSIFYDEKSQTVTISGPFDPQKLSKKLCYRACSVIKDMKIKDNNKPKETKPPAAEKPKPTEAAKDKPKDAKPAEAKTDKSGDKPKAESKPAKSDDKPKADAKSDDKPKADAKPAKSDEKPKEAAEVKNDKPPVEVTKNAYVGQVVDFGQTGYQPAWSTGGTGCYCSPWGYYGDYDKGCTCGAQRGCGWAPEGQQVVVFGGQSYGYQPVGPPPVVYGGPSYGYQQMGPPPVVYGGPTYEVGYQTTGKFFCEEAEDPQGSCSIM